MRRSAFKGILDPDAVRDAWQGYKHEGRTHMRERLILHYQPLVLTVAKRVGVNLPAHIDDEDLISYGLFGLLDAIEKFDPERGIKFETYASTRIHGAIIDELRSIDWVPRSVRSQVRSINQVTQDLEVQLQRQPNDAEIAEALGVAVEALHRSRGQQNFIHLAALDALVGPDDESEYSLMNQLQDNRAQSPALAYETEEIKNALALAVAQLPERESIVLCLYYYEGLTLAEIGDALKVTESRVCQMHTRAMTAVRGRLAVA